MPKDTIDSLMTAREIELIKGVRDYALAVRDEPDASNDAAWYAADAARDAGEARGADASEEFERLIKGYIDAPTHTEGVQILNDGLERYNA